MLRVKHVPRTDTHRTGRGERRRFDPRLPSLKRGQNAEMIINAAGETRFRDSGRKALDGPAPATDPPQWHGHRVPTTARPTCSGARCVIGTNGPRRPVLACILVGTASRSGPAPWSRHPPAAVLYEQSTSTTLTGKAVLAVARPTTRRRWNPRCVCSSSSCARSPYPRRSTWPPRTAATPVHGSSDRSTELCTAPLAGPRQSKRATTPFTQIARNARAPSRQPRPASAPLTDHGSEGASCSSSRPSR